MCAQYLTVSTPKRPLVDDTIFKVKASHLWRSYKHSVISQCGPAAINEVTCTWVIWESFNRLFHSKKRSQAKNLLQTCQAKTVLDLLRLFAKENIFLFLFFLPPSRKFLVPIMKALILIIVLAALASSINAQNGCTTASDPENICLYGTANLNGFGDNMQQQICQAVNANPFAYPTIASYAHCEHDVRADGSDCIKFYAKYQCSGVCARCNLQLCPSYCDDYQSKCPTAAASGCFQGISCAGTPGTTPPSCVDWSIDSSKIPAGSPTTSLTTKKTSTTTTRAAATSTTHNTATTTSGNSGTSTSKTTTTSEDGSFSSASTISFGTFALVAAGLFFFVLQWF